MSENATGEEELRTQPTTEPQVAVEMPARTSVSTARQSLHELILSPSLRNWRAHPVAIRLSSSFNLGTRTGDEQARYFTTNLSNTFEDLTPLTEEPSAVSFYYSIVFILLLLLVYFCY